jgi:hypothetical protein
MRIGDLPVTLRLEEGGEKRREICVYVRIGVSVYGDGDELN